MVISVISGEISVDFSDFRQSCYRNKSREREKKNEAYTKWGVPTAQSMIGPGNETESLVPPVKYE